MRMITIFFFCQEKSVSCCLPLCRLTRAFPSQNNKTYLNFGGKSVSSCCLQLSRLFFSCAAVKLSRSAIVAQTRSDHIKIIRIPAPRSGTKLDFQILDTVTFLKFCLPKTLKPITNLLYNKTLIIFENLTNQTFHDSFFYKSPNPSINSQPEKSSNPVPQYCNF